GGLVAGISMLLFYALEYLGHGRFPGGYAFMLVSAPSVIFLCCGYLRARQIRNMNAEPPASPYVFAVNGKNETQP
ncbi:MAG: hypothetical protein WCP39_05625, partial [Chlamydiota bacterium]